MIILMHKGMANFIQKKKKKKKKKTEYALTFAELELSLYFSSQIQWTSMIYKVTSITLFHHNFLALNRFTIFPSSLSN